MPNPDNIDQINEPIQIATDILTAQMEGVFEQITGGQQVTRQMRLGDLPADPIIEAVVAQIPEG
jgi:hypothetical protein